MYGAEPRKEYKVNKPNILGNITELLNYFRRNKEKTNRVTVHESYCNSDEYGKEKWGGLINIETDIMSYQGTVGMVVTIKLIKNCETVDELMTSFTEKTLEDDIRNPHYLEEMRKKHGDEAANALDEALIYVNQKAHDYFRNPPKKAVDLSDMAKYPPPSYHNF